MLIVEFSGYKRMGKFIQEGNILLPLHKCFSFQICVALLLSSFRPSTIASPFLNWSPLISPSLDRHHHPSPSRLSPPPSLGLSFGWSSSTTSLGSALLDRKPAASSAQVQLQHLVLLGLSCIGLLDRHRPSLNLTDHLQQHHPFLFGSGELHCLSYVIRFLGVTVTTCGASLPSCITRNLPRRDQCALVAADWSDRGCASWKRLHSLLRPALAQVGFLLNSELIWLAF